MSCRHLAEQPDHGAVEEVALGVGIGALGRGQFPQPLSKGGDDPGELGAMAVDMGAQRLFGCVGHVVAEGLDEGPVGGAEVLVAAAEQHSGASASKARARRLGGKVVLPMPASPEIRTTSRPSPAATRLKASASSGRLGVSPDHPDGRAR